MIFFFLYLILCLILNYKDQNYEENEILIRHELLWQASLKFVLNFLILLLRSRIYISLPYSRPTMRNRSSRLTLVSPIYIPINHPPETQFACLEIPLLRCNLDHIAYSPTTPIYPFSVYINSRTLTFMSRECLRRNKYRNLDNFF